MNISPIPGILSKKHSIVEESNVGLIYFGIISSWLIILILLSGFNHSGIWLSVTIKIVPLCQGKYFFRDLKEYRSSSAERSLLSSFGFPPLYFDLT